MFEGLDAKYKGYITFVDIMDLETYEREDIMLQVWIDSMIEKNRDGGSVADWMMNQHHIPNKI